MLRFRGTFVLVSTLTALFVASAGIAHQAMAQGKDVVVLAAASLKNALDEASPDWARKTGKTTRISYAASSALARQIEAGIPADIFISADVPWMDHVAERKLIKPASRSDYLGNQIVLIAGKDSRIDLRIGKGFDLRGALGSDGGSRWAASRRCRRASTARRRWSNLGVWSSVADRVAQAENVRMALTLVSRGEARSASSTGPTRPPTPAVRIVGAFPADSHPAIIYPMALLSTSANPDAQAFVDYLKSPAAKPFFERQGFAVLN